MLPQIWPMSTAWSMLAKIGPTSAGIRPISANLGRIGPQLANISQTWSKLAKCWLNLTDGHQRLAHIGHVWPRCSQHLSNLANRWPKEANLGRISVPGATLRQLWSPRTDRIPARPTSGTSDVAISPDSCHGARRTTTTSRTQMHAGPAPRALAHHYFDKWVILVDWGSSPSQPMCACRTRVRTSPARLCAPVGAPAGAPHQQPCTALGGVSLLLSRPHAFITERFESSTRLGACQGNSIEARSGVGK